MIIYILCILAFLIVVFMFSEIIAGLVNAKKYLKVGVSHKMYREDAREKVEIYRWINNIN